MRERVANLLDGQNKLPFVSTFHSLGVFILRSNAESAGLSKYFTIYDRGESKSKIREAMKATGIDEKRFDAGKMLFAISKQKGDGVSLSEYFDNTENIFQRTVATIWRRYEELLKKENALDFDDLLLKTVSLLENNQEILAHYQSRWTHIHIDEYQDTNVIQYKMSQLLAKKHQNICVVGDMDQSIYSWR
jgi:DNA helicase-2/ATP-dependent DNA helicase PcrA